MDTADKGFVIVAQNSDACNYVQQAHALALSIKRTQSVTTSVTLISDAKSLSASCNLLNVFDFVIELSEDKALASDWKIENRTEVFRLSPYQRTIVLDADMIFLSDYASWWEINADVTFCDTVLRYDRSISSSDFYRKTFTANKLPNFYSALFYFEKTESAKKFFDDAEYIVNNWQEVYFTLLDHTRPKHLSMDVVYSIAAKINNVLPDRRLKFVHGKTNTLRYTESTLSWDTFFQTYFTDSAELYLNNYKIKEPFHYHLNHWLTDEILSRIEK